MLVENGYSVSTHAYLVYYYPREVGEHGAVQFEVRAVKIQTDIERVRKMFREVVDLLRGEMPREHAGGANGGAGCEFGVWHKLAMEFN